MDPKFGEKDMKNNSITGGGGYKKEKRKKGKKSWKEEKQKEEHKKTITKKEKEREKGEERKKGSDWRLEIESFPIRKKTTKKGCKEMARAIRRQIRVTDSQAETGEQVSFYLNHDGATKHD